MLGWKPEYVIVVEEGLAAGQSAEIIAQSVNAKFGTEYSAKAVERKIDRIDAARGPKWPDNAKTELVALFNDPAMHSGRDIADKLNEKFGTRYTKNAVISQSKRMGLVRDKPVGVHKPRIRVVDANSNSKAKRVVLSVEAETKPVLRCVPVPFRGLSLLDLEDNDCRYPQGGANDEPITFCGCPRYSYLHFGRERRSSYCRSHHDLTIKIDTPVRVGVAA